MLIPLKMVTPAENQFNEVGHAQLHRRHIRKRVAEKDPINLKKSFLIYRRPF